MSARLYTRKQLAEKTSLTDQDLVQINRCRRPNNRLGFGYQIGFVKLLNRFPAQNPLEIIDELLGFIGVQLGLDASAIDEYQHRRETIAEHQDRIRIHLHLKRFGLEETCALETFLFDACCRLEQKAALLAQAREFLKEQKVLLPADSTLIRIVVEQRKLAREHIFARIAADLPDTISGRLEDLLHVKADESVSDLQKIKANPRKPSAKAMRSLTDKLAAIEGTNILNVDLPWLNGNYQRALFHYVRKCSVHRLREVSPARRQAAMVCFLRQSFRDAVDQAVDMFDKLITRAHNHAEQDLADQLRQQRQTIKEALASYRSWGKIILETSQGDEALRDRLFEAVPREVVTEQIERIAEWVSGKKSDVFHGLVNRFSSLRQFSPVFLKAQEFIKDTEGADLPSLEAVQVLQQLNEQGKRKLPKDAPIDFIPKRLRPIVLQGGKPERRTWECALLLQLQDDLKAGNLSVSHSKRFGKFDDYFIADDRWESLRDEFFQRSGLPVKPQDVPDYLTERLSRTYNDFLKEAPNNRYATVDDEGWHFATDDSEKLDAESETRLDHLRKWLAEHMRSIRLADLLIEVDNDLRFTNHFLPVAQRDKRDPKEICLTLATIMAHGCNIGPHTMAQRVPGTSYKQLKRVSDWLLTEDTQRVALAALVDGISRLDITLHWGEGKTSASDGQRFALPRKVLQQTYSTKFSDFALEFYSFLADNFAPWISGRIRTETYGFEFKCGYKCSQALLVASGFDVAPYKSSMKYMPFGMTCLNGSKET